MIPCAGPCSDLPDKFSICGLADGTGFLFLNPSFLQRKTVLLPGYNAAFKIVQIPESPLVKQSGSLFASEAIRTIKE